MILFTNNAKMEDDYFYKGGFGQGRTKRRENRKREMI